MTDVKIDLNLRPLNDLRKKMKMNVSVKVGVLGSTNSRDGGGTAGLTNAEIGVIHEFGSVSKRIPARSFLRMPLESHQDQLIEVFGKKEVKKKVLQGNLIGAMQDLAFVAEQIIDDAFKSRGFGNWAPNKPLTVKKKKSSNPLIDTSQLRRSITSEVEVKK